MLPSGFFAWTKLAAVLAIVLALAFLYVRFRSLQIEAARVPVLESRIAGDDAAAAALAKRLAVAAAARAGADAALSRWEARKRALLDTIEKEDVHVSAETDSACLPRASDRELRNRALERLTGFDEAGGTARLP